MFLRYKKFLFEKRIMRYQTEFTRELEKKAQPHKHKILYIPEDINAHFHDEAWTKWDDTIFGMLAKAIKSKTVTGADIALEYQKN